MKGGGKSAKPDKVRWCIQGGWKRQSEEQAGGVGQKQQRGRGWSVGKE